MRATFQLLANSALRMMDGVFAINKPGGMSSADVIRRLKGPINRSEMFSKIIYRERAEISSHPRDRSRRKKRVEVKMGHGGTLDPMATGVLIIGVGKGTKMLQGFLGGKKSYEATCLFGVTTDTYDRLGVVLGRAPYEHLTEEIVAEALEKNFQGTIMQKPPLYSALRMNGKKLYEYAREGKEIPREIEKRKVEIAEMRITEWLKPGSHDHRWPEKEGSKGEKNIAQKLLHVDELPSNEGNQRKVATPEKRKHEASDEDNATETGPETKRTKVTDEHPAQTVDTTSTEQPSDVEQPSNPATLPVGTVDTTSTEQSSNAEQPSQSAMPPAAKIFMTVGGGFYVRSLCQDLGQAVGSLGTMSTLCRTKQGGFEVGKNLMELEDFEKGEEVWGPKLEKQLQDWDERMMNEPTYSRGTLPRRRRNDSSSPSPEIG